MKNEEAKDMYESMMFLLAQFQKGFETIRRENKGLDNEEILALTSIWWDGMMKMIGMIGYDPQEGDDLWYL